ncbi:delta-9 fatty acid desaturase protein [Favolaschia claudopus]|uniref:E3 ubiquitin-protein ligase listerin n=1 Tax=Favolaschia claudopus TaxID=2862362 RepID=A0AAW0E799_9AGAR
MPPKSSSASSGTRKKHARKAVAAGGGQQLPEPQQKSDRKSKKHRSDPPRPKVYIAPVKPTAANPDPLDAIPGLSNRLPPTLLVVLRSLGKKAVVTRAKALEELGAGWVSKIADDDEGIEVYALKDALPVWLHHLPSLLVHPSRRIRLLSAQTHSALLASAILHPSLVEDVPEIVRGVWALAAYDSERAVASVVSQSPVEDNDGVVQFIERVILHPDEVYDQLNPPAPSIPDSVVAKGAKHPQAQAGKRPAMEAEVTSRKADDQEESAFDRRARLRIAAFGALKGILETTTSTLPPFLASPSLWSALQDTDAYSLSSANDDDTEGLPEDDLTSPPAIDSEADTLPLGRAQPVLRRAAWSLLGAVLTASSLPSAILQTLAHTVLPALWTEADAGVQRDGAMWKGGVGLVRSHSEIWTAERFQVFLRHFISRACNSSASNTSAAEAGYGAVVLILGGVPDSILLAPGQETLLFEAFWAALGGPPSLEAAVDQDRAHEESSLAEKRTPAPALTSALPPARARAGAAFASALLECGIFIVKRTRAKAPNSEIEDDSHGGHKYMLNQEMKRVWVALGGALPRQEENKPRLYIDARRAADILCETLYAAAGVGGDLLNTTLETLGACVRAGGPPALICAVIGALLRGNTAEDSNGVEQLGDNAQPLTKVSAEARMRAYAQKLRADVLRGAAEREDQMLLVQALKTFGGGDEVWVDGVGEALDALLTRRSYALLLIAPQLLFAYLKHRTCPRQRLWVSLLREIATHPEAIADALTAVVGESVLDELSAVDRETVSPGPLDALFANDQPLPVPPSLLVRVLQRGPALLSTSAIQTTISRIVQRFADRVEGALAGSSRDDEAFTADLELLLGVPNVTRTHAAALLPAVYVFAYVLSGPGHAVTMARTFWVRWKDSNADEAADVIAEVKRRLNVLVRSTDVYVTPEDVLNALSEGTLGASGDIAKDLFPSRTELNDMLERIPADPPASSLAVLHPHLPPASAIQQHKPAPAHDARGLATYSRIVAGLLHALTADRRAARDNVWALRHVLFLELAAEDAIAVPAALNALFDESVERTSLEGIVERAQQLTAYILTAMAEDGWRAPALDTLNAGKPIVGGGALSALLVEVVESARRTDGVRECRVLNRILRHVLQDADKAEADLWIGLARKMEKNAPETCIAIVSAVSASNLEPLRLDRYRNELAADLLGVSASKANTQGLLTLRKLAASAPSGDSDVVFLPQQRSVNIFKACQQWIASDEEMDEELESTMTLVFYHLAPLLQNVPGTHWDLIFDVVETNIESVAWTNEETLVTLARTLRLILLIQDLTLTNKTLRASWEERQMQILTMVRDMAAGQLDDVVPSSPRSTCRELVVQIVQDLPPSLITEDTLPKMCHLLVDPSVDVQKMTYQLLTVAARKRTEHFVIEAGVDVDATVKADLPPELLDILQMSLNLNEGEVLDLDESLIFGYLLGWMVVFDLFSDASLKVRLSYIDQLRTLKIIATSFIPNLLGILGVDQGIPKAFKLDMWIVEEYFVQLYESGSTWSLQVLAAHLYYRALLTVPSLIYNWVLDCKDRQLSSSIATYTSLYFSPVIIRAELAHVKSPDAAAELASDNLTVKVAPAVNEVMASYLVDEHQLEIKLKIPSDWPLRKIEVKDVQRVGVDEPRWRAWILAVQQTLWSQNGRIVDGLGSFKKNVTGYFEGQVECAICYSIISVLDGSLPKKPCKTCKNRFHSSCLYKWFSTSHSSSCPLCRSDIM